jgi:hypothetical protein
MDLRTGTLMMKRKRGRGGEGGGGGGGLRRRGDDAEAANGINIIESVHGEK